MTNRLQRAARAFADDQSGQRQEPPSDRAVHLTVTAISPTLTVEWRGNPNCPAKRCAAYTPGVGDRVLCQVVDNQITIVDRIV